MTETGKKRNGVLIIVVVLIITIILTFNMTKLIFNMGGKTACENSGSEYINGHRCLKIENLDLCVFENEVYIKPDIIDYDLDHISSFFNNS